MKSLFASHEVDDNYPAPALGGSSIHYPRTIEDEVARMYTASDIVGTVVHGLERAVTTNTDPRPAVVYQRTEEDAVNANKTAARPDEAWAQFSPDPRHLL